jgi:hypothetical protein
LSALRFSLLARVTIRIWPRNSLRTRLEADRDGAFTFALPGLFVIAYNYTPLGLLSQGRLSSSQVDEMRGGVAKDRGQVPGFASALALCFVEVEHDDLDAPALQR